MTLEERREKARQARHCKFRNFLNKSFPQVEAFIDHEGNAAYWRGKWGRYPDALIIYLRARPHVGMQYRCMGEICNGVLHSSVWKRHPKFKCFCIARYVIEHADTLGFSAVEYPNNPQPVPVTELIGCPDLPREASATYERQIQLP